MTQEQQPKTVVFNKDVEELRKQILSLWEDRETGEISLREKIRTLAYEVEKSGTPTNKVSSTIIRMFKANFQLGIYIAHTLDRKYKRQYTIQEILSSDRNNTIEECSIDAEQLRDAIEKAKSLGPEELGRREFQDIAELAHELDHRCQDKAETYGIPLSFQKKTLGEDSKDDIISLEAALESDDEKVRILAKHAVKELEGVISITEDDIEDINVRHYVPRTPDKLEQYIVGLKATKLLLRPYNDKKWQRDWIEWCDIIEVYYESGGTRASGFSAVDIAGSINKKTGQPDKRKVTKEQIDAKYIPYLNDMRFMILNHPNNVHSQVIKNIEYGIDLKSGKLAIKRGKQLTKEQLEVLYPQILEAMRWLTNGWTLLRARSLIFRDTEEGYRAKRADDLHDKLSDAA